MAGAFDLYPSLHSLERMNLPRRTVTHAILAGLAWSALAVVLLNGSAYHSYWLLLVGLLVGPLVYLASAWTHRRPWWVMALWSIPSLWLGAVLFVVLANAFAWLLPTAAPGLTALKEHRLGGELLALLYGLMVVSPLWLLYPAAFLTQVWTGKSRKALA